MPRFIRVLHDEQIQIAVRPRVPARPATKQDDSVRIYGFNEPAYKILVNNGHGDRARRQYYNKPENALKMTIKGPAGDEQAYVDAFNEVFGG